MRDGSVGIVATGARTPVGLRAAPVATAIRAGIVALAEHPFMVDQTGQPMPGALDPELDPRLVGPDRLLALAATALREACEPLGHAAERLTQIPIFLALPEVRPGFTRHDAERVSTGLKQIADLPVAISDVNLLSRGHAAGLLALAVAKQRLQLGDIDTCIVGGVDSYFHPDTMEWLDANRQLVGSVSRSGFVPGEGAGFCLLVTGRACKRLGLDAVVEVRSVATSRETKLIKSNEICLAEALSAAVEEATKTLQLPEERIDDIVCDMNGERYRGEEWGFVCLRLSHVFGDPTEYVSPAESWGDVGAASGPLFTTLVCQAVARGYSKGPRTMVWASSEGGDRGAAVLEATAALH